jgi:hypothetical protein
VAHIPAKRKGKNRTGKNRTGKKALTGVKHRHKELVCATGNVSSNHRTKVYSLGEPSKKNERKNNWK